MYVLVDQSVLNISWYWSEGTVRTIIVFLYLFGHFQVAAFDHLDLQTVRTRAITTWIRIGSERDVLRIS